MSEKRNRGVMLAAFIGIAVVALILIAGTYWMGRSAGSATEEAVHSVSLFYLDELAGRREQVVASNLQTNINDIQVAVSLMDGEDLRTTENLQEYQSRIKKLYGLDKFAFVDREGRIYTSKGIRNDLEDYDFDPYTLERPDISVMDPENSEKTVIIAVPVEGLSVEGNELTACFAEISMERMLQGVSLQENVNSTTFCNIYTAEGKALTDMVLGGLASEDNLLDALKHAVYEPGYSYEMIEKDFREKRDGEVSFSYNGIQETLSYVPIDHTDWMLTYLIRESLISEQFSTVSSGIIFRSVVQTILAALALLGFFTVVFIQNRRSSHLVLEKETSEAAARVKQEEMEQRLVLQEQLLEQEKQRTQQDSMITALASDYRSVYYVDLDNGQGICYRSDSMQGSYPKPGESFPYFETFAAYARDFVAEKYRDGFLEFIDPESIRQGLEKESVITYRYLVRQGEKESYEMLRMAGVRAKEDREDQMIHAVGVGFTDVDSETREALSRSQALSDALTAAEEASKAKTAFLSNMSHEIRTPMNAIIGLDNVALNDPTLSTQTRSYLEKIDSSAQHLLALINDILDMSRIESGRLTLKNEEFSIQKLIEQINTLISGQCSEKGLEFNCYINGQIDDYYIGDNMKLRQVLVNILSNAVKFNKEGGSVDFTVERTASYDGKSTLRFTIRDTGIGMSPEYLPRLFEAFSQEDSSSTSKYGSSGLGMAITKNIVEMMNGSIDVESEKGKGTTFRVSVTLMEANHGETEESTKEMQPGDMSVLVVDDDPIACEHARLVLEKVGIACEHALSGAEALEMVKVRHARREPYNLILVDWKMPEMDGVETTRRIRTITGNESAIIILTAYKWDDVQEEALVAGVDSFISKPLFASNVMEEFYNAMKRKNVMVSLQEKKADLTGRRILLAEDVAVNAEIMMMVLQMREMTADHAENGKIALEKFRESPEGYYDAILMDMRMPEMDGLTATMEIRALPRKDAAEIPIIALTANAFDEDVQRSLQAGLNAHLSKPVEPDVLYETLESLIWARENGKQ